LETHTNFKQGGKNENQKHPDRSCNLLHRRSRGCSASPSQTWGSCAAAESGSSAAAPRSDSAAPAASGCGSAASNCGSAAPAASGRGRAAAPSPSSPQTARCGSAAAPRGDSAAPGCDSAAAPSSHSAPSGPRSSGKRSQTLKRTRQNVCKKKWLLQNLIVSASYGEGV